MLRLIKIHIICILLTFALGKSFAEYAFGFRLKALFSSGEPVYIDNLIFGLDGYASDGLDPGIDGLMPPPPPIGGFYWYFVPDSTSDVFLRTDIRNLTGDEFWWQIQTWDTTSDLYYTGWCSDSIIAYPWGGEFRIGASYPPSLPTEWVDMASESLLAFSPGQIITIHHTGTGVDDPLPLSASGFALGDPYPNPFNSSVNIIYRFTSGNGRCRLIITDLLGNVIFRQLLQASTGSNVFIWDGKSCNGDNVPSGIYVLNFEHKGITASRSVLFLK
ncbi:T9SS type A sorting domain-containing protein [bacterium]|nr:T9SS type A sorting domain-containing protein [bacterium]